jgi:hypothetical protein
MIDKLVFNNNNKNYFNYIVVWTNALKYGLTK